MCALVIFSLFSFSSVSASAATYDVDRLVALAEKYPQGRYWNHAGSSSNNPDGYTSTPCTHHSGYCGASCSCNYFFGATQCKGYSYKLANELVGTDPRNWDKRYSLNISSLCVGDVIRYLNNGHSIVVVGVSGNTIAYTGANWGRNCLIKWGTLTASQLRGFSYVLHDRNNTMKNSDLDFFEGVKAKSNVNFVKASATSKAESWKNTTKNAIDVYNLPFKGAFRTGSIKKSKTISVTEKYYDGKALWGKVSTGWVKLNKLTFKGGNYEKPTLNDVSKAVTGKKFKLSWKSIEGATTYTVKLIKKGTSGVYKTYTTDKNKLNLKVFESGTYRAYVIAQNEKNKSWALQSSKTSFEVKKNKSLKNSSARLVKASAPESIYRFFK